MFIVKNGGIDSFLLQDAFISLVIQSGESVDLEAIFSHEQLYYSSLATGALWLSITSGSLLRRDNSDTVDIPIASAFYDAVWRYSPNQGQWEALVGTVPIPSSDNKYVTEADFGIFSTIQTFDASPETLYEAQVPLNSVMLLQTWVTAARNSGLGSVGDSATLIKVGTIKNVANVLSLKLVESAYTYRDQQWLVFLDTFNDQVRVRVKGSLATTITWSGKTRSQVQVF